MVLVDPDHVDTGGGGGDLDRGEPVDNYALHHQTSVGCVFGGNYRDCGANYDQSSTPPSHTNDQNGSY